MYRTRRVTPRRIEAALAELRGEEPDAAGAGKQEARRDGLIAAADFAVYLREFGSICGRSALLLATMASAASSVPPPLPLSSLPSAQPVTLCQPGCDPTQPSLSLHAPGGRQPLPRPLDRPVGGTRRADGRGGAPLPRDLPPPRLRDRGRLRRADAAPHGPMLGLGLGLGLGPGLARVRVSEP